jgi:hypothetical protein
MSAIVAKSTGTMQPMKYRRGEDKDAYNTVQEGLLKSHNRWDAMYLTTHSNGADNFFLRAVRLTHGWNYSGDRGTCRCRRALRDDYLQPCGTTDVNTVNTPCYCCGVEQFWIQSIPYLAFWRHITALLQIIAFILDQWYSGTPYSMLYVNHEADSFTPEWSPKYRVVASLLGTATLEKDMRRLMRLITRYGRPLVVSGS